MKVFLNFFWLMAVMAFKEINSFSRVEILNDISEWSWLYEIL